MRNTKRMRPAAPVSAAAEEREPAPAQPAEWPPAPAPDRSLTAVRRAAREFLAAEFQAREMRVTKIAHSSNGEEGWFVEAEMLVPDLGIKTLGLPLTQEVLERALCAVALNDDLTISSFELVESRER